MEGKPLIYYIYGDIVDAVRGICQNVYLGRPKQTTVSHNDFIVVELPTEIRDRIKGGGGVMVETYATITIYFKAKSDNTLNIFSMSDYIQKVLDVFPINGKHITATNPKVLMQGEDGYTFHSTLITFKVRTKFNAINNN